MSIAQFVLECNINIYPKIAAVAIASGQAEAYRLYSLVLARARATRGRYIFSRTDLRALGVLSDQQIDRALALGCGVFWFYSPAHRSYRMSSQANIALALGFSGNPGRAVTLPIAAFEGRLSNFKAAVYAAYLAQQRRPTTSRTALAKLFGVSVPTLLAWEKKLGVQVLPRTIVADVPDGSQPLAVALEIEKNRTARTWLQVMGPRGRRIAKRRLMDNTNTPLDDYWQVQEEPGWEEGSEIKVCWQTTNFYRSPLNVAPSGRGCWLERDIKRHSIPDTKAKGSTEGRINTRLGWLPDEYTAIKWQHRRRNRCRPAVVEQVKKDEVLGTWLPSHSALWEENVLS